jgi:hypothetical protein
MKEWQLIDFLNPLEDDQEEAPRLVVRSEEQLREQLKRLQQRRPAMIALISPQDERLDFGIGGPWSGVQWTKPPYSENLRIAIAANAQVQSGIEFACEGSVSGFRPEHVLPVENVIEIVVFFFKHHRLPEWIPWLEWNAKTGQKNMTPAKGSPPVVQTFDVGVSTPPPAMPS